MSGKRRSAAAAIVAIVAFMALVMVGVHERGSCLITESAKMLSSAIQAMGVPAALAEPASAATCASTQVTLKNQNPYTIFLGENVSAGGVVTPPGNNWEMPPGGSVSLCLPGNWTSGVLWARTQCNFSGTFGKDPNYKACTSNSDCTLQEPSDPSHICVGGTLQHQRHQWKLQRAPQLRLRRCRQREVLRLC